VHPLERIGWVTGIVASGLTIITFFIPELPSEGKYGLAILAALALGVAAYWSRMDKVKNQIHETTEDTSDRGKPKNRRPFESNLDDLIKEIEDFIHRWREGSGLTTSYRRFIPE
jgi:hypothetical protein